MTSWHFHSTLADVLGATANLIDRASETAIMNSWSGNQHCTRGESEIDQKKGGQKIDKDYQV
jgi:hypothetical protein